MSRPPSQLEVGKRDSSFQSDTERAEKVSSQALLSLAARCEAATGPDRELDGAIKLAYAACLFAGGCAKDEAVRILNGDLYADPLPYTASIDAAMTLVPEGMEWEVGTAHLISHCWAGVIDLDVDWKCKGATPALALCAAALKARAAI